MTYSDTQPRGTLRYRLLSASLLPPSSPLSEPGSWGHEYVRHIAAELGEEFSLRQTSESESEPEPTPAESGTDAAKSKPEPKSKRIPVGSIDDLRALGMQCATFLLGHNAEPDAVDLLEELEMVNRIVEVLDENTYSRVAAYMIR
jgi:26S proteasome regulatory subunit N1